MTGLGKGKEEMAIFYLVRHGEPDYAALEGSAFFGFGRDLAPLSEKGIRQAREAAKDEGFKNAERIVSSPYTRALQTAQIIAEETRLPVTVELLLHEWLPDLSGRYATSQESFALAEEFVKYRGEYPEGREMPWESLSMMRRRMRLVADKYAACGSVILVGHGMAFRTLAYIEHMKPGEIVECRYETGQADCVYSFY